MSTTKLTAAAAAAAAAAAYSAPSEAPVQEVDGRGSVDLKNKKSSSIRENLAPDKCTSIVKTSHPPEQAGNPTKRAKTMATAIATTTSTSAAATTAARPPRSSLTALTLTASQKNSSAAAGTKKKTKFGLTTATATATASAARGATPPQPTSTPSMDFRPAVATTTAATMNRGVRLSPIQDNGGDAGQGINHAGPNERSSAVDMAGLAQLISAEYLLNEEYRSYLDCMLRHESSTIKVEALTLLTSMVTHMGPVEREGIFQRQVAFRNWNGCAKVIGALRHELARVVPVRGNRDVVWATVHLLHGWTRDAEIPKWQHDMSHRGGVAAVADAMKSFPDDADIQHEAIMCLYHYDARVDDPNPLFESNVMLDACSAMIVHPSRHDMVWHALDLLHSLCKSADETGQKFPLRDALFMWEILDNVHKTTCGPLRDRCSDLMTYLRVGETETGFDAPYP